MEESNSVNDPSRFSLIDPELDAGDFFLTFSDFPWRPNQPDNGGDGRPPEHCVA